MAGASEHDELVSIVALLGGSLLSTISLCCLCVGTRRIAAFEQEKARRGGLGMRDEADVGAGALGEASRWQQLCGDWISSQSSGVVGLAPAVTAGTVHAFEVRVRLASGRLAESVAKPFNPQAPLGARTCDRMMFGDGGERAGYETEPETAARRFPAGERVSLVDPAVDTDVVVVQVGDTQPEPEPEQRNPYGLQISVEGSTRRLRPTHRKVGKGRVAVEWASRRAGTYQISVRLGSAHIQGSPFAVNVAPSDVSPSHSIVCDGDGLIEQGAAIVATAAAEAATLIAVQGAPVQMKLVLRDQYCNPLSTRSVLASGVADPDAVSVVLTASSTGAPDHAPAFEYEASPTRSAQTLGIRLLLTVYVSY